ncbi:MAG TPA: hypothetical protein VGD10_01385 [Allosphingosinicella sp.]|uniref:hypothetical protein n=1 Tax=Allosphingosinicella sp. TaxID=2823234 RepID=UPI002ED8AC2F
MAEKEEKPKTDPAGGAEGGMAEGGAGGPGQGNGLVELSDEAVRELEKGEEPHAGRGDYG